jgi:hypothetical protein
MNQTPLRLTASSVAIDPSLSGQYRRQDFPMREVLDVDFFEGT